MLKFLKHLFKLQFILVVLGVIIRFYYPSVLEFCSAILNKYADHSSSEELTSIGNQKDGQLYTKAELAKYDGNNGAPIYLALLGNVYDVSKGEKFYGPGCNYNFFVGRDASVSFVSGEFDYFDETEADNVLTLKPSDLLSLENWKLFYEKDYTLKGKMIGRFYDEAGVPTAYYYKYKELLALARKSKTEDEQMRIRYPDCNIEWSAEKGTRVWCTTTSGGQQRDWLGHPRKFYETGAEKYRCACISTEDLDTSVIMIKSYDNCERMSYECYYRVD